MANIDQRLSDLVSKIDKHSFDSWSKDLMNTPPVINEWQNQQVGEKNDGPYRKGYQELPIKENGDPLVNAAAYGVISWDYYLNKLFDELLNNNKEFLPAFENRLLFPFAWIRKSIAVRLQKADKLLRQHDFYLSLNSGWRHPNIQQIARDLATKRAGTEVANQLFSNPQTGVSPHSTGGACDVQLWSLQTGDHLDFTYLGDDYGFYNLELKKDLDDSEKKKREIRRILYHVLCTPSVCLTKREVLTIHPGEYWHFGDQDPLSAYLKGQPFAEHGPIEPPKDFRITRFS